MSIRIKTKKFILRPFALSDAKDIAKNINNPKIARNMSTVPHPYTLAEAKKWLRKTVAENKKNHNKINWAILIDGEVVGSIGGEIHKQGHKLSFGYWLAEKHWRQGIITEAIKEFTNYLFNKRKLKRIEAQVFPFNKGSMRVLEKNGFKLEGILKKNHNKDGKLLDTYIFAKVK
jgi:ribosomal-protein-alanine N-acetyltransferase